MTQENVKHVNRSKKCCGTHSKEKENNGECCQTKEKDNAETLTAETENKRSNNE